AGAARVARMLATALASADGRWVLRRRTAAAAELALTSVGAGGMAETRVVDRSFVEDGVRWIIDYKTADLGAGADAVRLTTHAARYRPQLEAYAELFAAEGLPQRLAVFYVAHGILASLEYNSRSD
ncbi:MAG: DNA helicase, partial [Sulfuritalea sp.]|nr:DNA helicase [Sulfuritalea sp.]